MLINRKIQARLLLDTGATHTQLSSAIIEKLGIKKGEGEKIVVKVAGGYAVGARAINLKELRLSGVRAYNVRAIVLDADIKSSYDGLLGMSYLNNFKFSIDAEKGELTLEKPGN
ncbi:TIGR02281 family clan AA aspartic protease [Thermoproteota archaeon]